MTDGILFLETTGTVRASSDTIPIDHCAFCRQLEPPNPDLNDSTMSMGSNTSNTSDALFNWTGCDGCLKWFHNICLDLKDSPQGDWYCYQCRTIDDEEQREDLEPQDADIVVPNRMEVIILNKTGLKGWLPESVIDSMVRATSAENNTNDQEIEAALSIMQPTFNTSLSRVVSEFLKLSIIPDDEHRDSKSYNTLAPPNETSPKVMVWLVF
ncbi:hypothetical protein AKO1_001066 [Acrasis kona]|uniref:PHD-type domain-containing protein n=1 Tax=Acrasis kona TaxID=1008807 RepID=A0AAW2ZS90_9EUKA